MYVRVEPVIDHSVRALCTLPYSGHEQGCPHYGKREICPPNAPLFDQYFDLNKPVYAVFITFDLAGHVARLRVSHPDWGDEKLQDWNLWNAQTRAALDKETAQFLEEHPGYTIVHCPEAMGVNITETVRRVGIELHWRQPISTIHRIALAGIKQSE